LFRDDDDRHPGVLSRLQIDRRVRSQGGTGDDTGETCATECGLSLPTWACKPETCTESTMIAGGSCGDERDRRDDR
jgi:hypothetical protein